MKTMTLLFTEKSIMRLIMCGLPEAGSILLPPVRSALCQVVLWRQVKPGFAVLATEVINLSLVFTHQPLGLRCGHMNDHAADGVFCSFGSACPLLVVGPRGGHWFGSRDRIRAARTVGLFEL